eukprot:g4355.t1
MRAAWVSWAAAAAVLFQQHGVRTEAFSGCSTKLLGTEARHRLLMPRTLFGTSSRTAAGAVATTGHAGDPRALFAKSSNAVDAEDLEGTMRRLTRTLEQDLPRQYEKPQDLSIFGDDVEFQDPVTTLRGKLPYRGMLFFTLLFFRAACKPGSSYFTVTTIDRPTRQTIRTVWETGAVTWTGRDLFISGVDRFTVGEGGRISRHDSAWDQTWEEPTVKVCLLCRLASGGVISTP